MYSEYILIVCCQNLEKSTRWNSLYLISFRLLIGLDLSSWCELSISLFKRFLKCFLFQNFSFFYKITGITFIID